MKYIEAQLYTLSCFLREIRKLNGNDYPPNTLKEVIVMLQMYLHERGAYWKLLEDPMFMNMRNVLDNTMKQRTTSGLGTKVSSEVISLGQESELFRQGLLGDDQPEKTIENCYIHVGSSLGFEGRCGAQEIKKTRFQLSNKSRTG